MTYSINLEHNGVELYFGEKPAQGTLDTLRANGWRWNGLKKCWYTKQTDESISFAKDLSEGKEPEAAEATETIKTKPVAYHKKVSDYISLELYEQRLRGIVTHYRGMYDREEYKEPTVQENLKGYNSDNRYYNLSDGIREAIVAKSIGMKPESLNIKYQAVWEELPVIHGLRPGKKYSAMWGYDQTQITTATHYGRAFGLDVLVTGGFGSGDILLKRIDKDGRFSESCMHFSPNTYTDEEIQETNEYASYHGR